MGSDSGTIASNHEVVHPSNLTCAATMFLEALITWSQVFQHPFRKCLSFTTVWNVFESITANTLEQQLSTFVLHVLALGPEQLCRYWSLAIKQPFS